MTMLSSQHHSFDILLAARFGVEEAILIHHFQHWIRINRANKRNIHLGRCWTYQTRKEIAERFPYFDTDRVRRLTERLVDMGVLIVANMNKKKMDKTLWYAFYDEKAFAVDEETSNILYERQNCHSSGEIANPVGKSAKAIPDTIPKDSKASDKKEREKAAPSPTPYPELPENIYTYTSQVSGKCRVWMDQQKYDKLLQEMGNEKLYSMLERLDEYADLNPKRFKQYVCHAAVIRKWTREDKEKNNKQNFPSESVEKEGIKAKSKAWAREVFRMPTYSKLVPSVVNMDRSQDYLEWTLRDGKILKIFYDDAMFKQLIISGLRKIGLSVEGL